MFTTSHLRLDIANTRFPSVRLELKLKELATLIQYACAIFGEHCFWNYTVVTTCAYSLRSAPRMW